MWVVIGIAGLVFFVILVLSIPFSFEFKTEFYSKFNFRLRITWLFGLVRKDLNARKKQVSERDQTKKQESRKFEIGKILKRGRTIYRYLRIKGLLLHLILFVRNVFHVVKIRKLEAEFHVGLDDPSETFYIFALTQPFNLLFNRSLPYPVYIYPSFIGPVFEGYMRAEIRMYPVFLVPPILRLIFSVITLRVVKTLLASRWKRNASR